MRSPNKYEIKLFKGKDIEPFLDEIGSLRVKVFREFPYLYDGDLETERKYIAEYAKSDKSVLIAAFVDKQIIGFVTGTALDSGLEIIRTAYELFNSRSLIANNYYYIGEIIILEEYRSFSLSLELIKQIGTFAKNSGYTSLCFLTVIREAGHPLKPAHYRSTAKLWEFYKAKKMNMSVDYEWKTLINSSESMMQTNKLEFWERSLNN